MGKLGGGKTEGRILIDRRLAKKGLVTAGVPLWGGYGGGSGHP